MRFDPNVHHRQSIRLRGYDYSQTNAYFVTICVYRKENLFGEIKNGIVELNDLGSIVQSVWDELPVRYPNIDIDEFVIMPNHVHGIVWIRPVGAPLVGALRSAAGTSIHLPLRAGTRPAPTRLGDIVGGFKSITAVEYIRFQKRRNPNDLVPKLWQRNYYEHIIRSESELHSVRQYIRDNPLKWESDPERKA